jgi:NadR type nicotinamide-nucleotide adenylyltransferase
MPPHLGHLYLVDFARTFADTLTIVVGSLEDEPIPGAWRYQWMKELFPSQEVLHLTDPNPQYPNEHPDFWNIWKRSLEGVCSRPADLLFASEEYGAKLAEVLGAQFIPTNGMRECVPVSGTQIREAPLRHWDLIPRVVRPHFVKTVVFVGPESTGKTVLSRKLAENFGASWVPEYARTYLRGRADDFSLEDMETIAKGQRASTEAARRLGKPLVVSDTDALTTLLWCQELFGEVPESVLNLARCESPDLTFVMKPDVPWVEGELRLRPETRQAFFERCMEMLRKMGRDFLVVGGDWKERERDTLGALERLTAS